MRARARRERAQAVLPLTPAAMTLKLVLIYKELLEFSVAHKLAAQGRGAQRSRPRHDRSAAAARRGRPRLRDAAAPARASIRRVPGLPEALSASAESRLRDRPAEVHALRRRRALRRARARRARRARRRDHARDEAMAAATASPRVTPLIVDPPYLGRTMRDARLRARRMPRARRSCPATLVQSHERIACCDIYRAGDGVHAVWVEERLRDASPAERLALAASPYHRYMLGGGAAPVREPAPAPGDLHLAAWCRPRSTSASAFRASACRSIYNAIDPRRVQSGPRPCIATTFARDTASPPMPACSCSSARSTRARASGARSRRSRRCRAPAHLLVVGRDRHPSRYAALARRLRRRAAA